ncbi:transposase, partial [Enterococcus faecium]|nr:transposase [Enterococcus faecium]
ALHYSYSNGPLECLNNHIKVLKRNAYGFRNFYNFKLRIMIRHGKTFLGSIISRTDRKSFYRSLLSMKKQNIQKLR